MGSRRLARECALKILFQIELSNTSLDDALRTFWIQEEYDASVQEFAVRLVTGVVGEKEQIDQDILASSHHWKIDRMAPVDKNILRLAVYELKRFSDVPAKVTLNEAIEIAKKYGTEESGSFINGILDKIAKDLEKS